MAIANLTGMGQEIFEARYAYPGETRWALLPSLVSTL